MSRDDRDGHPPLENFPPSPEGSFAGRDLRRADFSNSRIRKCDFRRTDLDEARLDGVDCRESNFDDAQLFKMKARRATFSGSSFRGANLQGAILDGSDFSGADLSRADFKFSCLAGVRLEGTRVSNADFRFSRGLPLSEKTGLRSQGAKVTLWSDCLRLAWRPIGRTVWGKIIYAILGLGLIGLLYLFFSDYRFQSIPSLRAKAVMAQEQGLIKRAIRIDLALSRKFLKRENVDAWVTWQLAAANLNKAIQRRPRAFKMMSGLLKKVSDEIQISKIKLEQAIFYEEEARQDRARMLLKDIKPDVLECNFDASMKLAALYHRLNDDITARAVYNRLIERYGQDPALRAVVASELSKLSSESSSSPKTAKDRGSAGISRKTPGPEMK
jgi:uncharacterized protein YjbI with pentapeptide repeats